uniref:Uncharacterized protein n=1 Tax=Rhizophora mucronata TaxID=61149 RepID=A0A2P2N9S8_RHIMU
MEPVLPLILQSILFIFYNCICRYIISSWFIAYLAVALSCL